MSYQWRGTPDAATADHAAALIRSLVGKRAEVEVTADGTDPAGQRLRSLRVQLLPAEPTDPVPTPTPGPTP